MELSWKLVVAKGASGGYRLPALTGSPNREGTDVIRAWRLEFIGRFQC